MTQTHRDDSGHAAVRREIVEAMPDVTDPDNWPHDLGALAGRLLKPLETIDAMARLAQLTGQPTELLRESKAALEEAHNALGALQRISPLAAWRTLHPPRIDPLDSVYDCGNPACPQVGFTGPEDKALHYYRWGFG